MAMKTFFELFLGLCLALAASRTLAIEPEGARIPVLIDTDIGTAIDDAFALGLALASPELEVRGITTVGQRAEDRAWIVCRFLSHGGQGEIPVAWGRDPQPESEMKEQRQYRGHPGVLFGRTQKPIEESAEEFLYRMLKESPGELTVIALGPLTNIARLMERHPDCIPWIKRIVIMGGSLEVGYEDQPPPVAEWNIKSDVAAARAVFASGAPLVVVPLDATAGVMLKTPQLKQIFDACTLLSFQIQALYELSERGKPTLFDPVAVGLAFNEKFAQWEEFNLSVDDGGMTKTAAGKPNARVATSIDADAFPAWLTERLAAHGEQRLPRQAANISHLVPQGGFPHRVHVVEDYETEIERRWWMSGVAESENVPPGSRRACRGVTTQDFDDRQGDRQTAYTAVIFNPVPGPPMGASTRLAFRYWLKGTDTLRVQLYSLSNGYHRCLSIQDLPQDSWQTATVDMTQLRRPDGSGGPLAEDERIDDIQFYADPRAELIVDDVVLYDAAPPEEKRPFPKRIVFTGWFDTGKQGAEWPGDFEIVPHEPPRTWKAARSVLNEERGAPWIRIHLRGARPLPRETVLRFRYRLTGGDRMRIELTNSAELKLSKELDSLQEDEWSEAEAVFRLDDSQKEVGAAAEEIRFLISPGAELLVDDVLLFEP
jgi:inosine-uridine nucleoside N-ribohydrolase